MKPFHALVVLCLLAVTPLTAQTTRAPEVSLRLGLGLSYAGYREETYSPILQYLESSSWNVDLDIDDGATIHRVSAGFTMGRTHSAVSRTATLQSYYDEYSGQPVTVALASPISAVKGHLSYGLAVSAARAGPYEGFIGGSFRIDALIQIANYPSISAIFALGPVYRQRVTLSPRDKVECDLAAPLFAYAVRPPYAGADAELMHMAATNPLAIFATGSLVSLGRYAGVQADLAYVHEVDSALFLVYSATSSVFRIAVPLPRADAEVDLRAGAALGF